MTGWLLDTLLYTGILIALVLIVRRPAARLLGPEFAYSLWALPFLRLLLPPIVLPASFAPEPAAPAVPAAEVITTFGPMAENVGTAEAATSVTHTVDVVAASEPLWTWEAVAAPLLSVWLGVALAFLGWRVVTYRRMRHELLLSARPVGEAGRVRLVETRAVAAPVAFGVFDKVVALPVLFMAQYDRQGRDLAIEHELAHHRGHDLLINFLAQAVLAMHWFNPLAWAAWRAMRRDQEAACDARVLAGRDREERVRYAALIAEAAAGPRSIAFHGALAAPMAGPLFGEKSIIHRLKILSQSDVTRRRRRVGNGLIAVSALALPLTASFSYAALAEVQAPDVPPVPAASSVPSVSAVPPAVPNAPVAPEASEAPELRVPAPPAPPAIDLPPLPPVPKLDLRGARHPSDPEFEARMEEFSRYMEAWGEKAGEFYAARAEAYAASAVKVAHMAPEVVESCDEREMRRTHTADGRTRVVICERQYTQMARNSLRQARDSIAADRNMSAAMRAEIVADLDDEIAQMDREAR